MTASNTTPIYGFAYSNRDTDQLEYPDVSGETFLGQIEAVLARIDTPATFDVFTASGTWTKPANAKKVRIRAAGGGGGGGGTTGAGSGVAAGGGGGGAGYCESLLDASALTSTVVVTIGAGGAGGVNGSTAGAAGGDTTFGSYLTAGGGAVGGAGGTASTGSLVADSGFGGVPTGGTVINIPGSGGGIGRTITGNSVFTNCGGASHLSGQAKSVPDPGAAGLAGVNYGGGGAGGYCTTVSRAGGAGAGGIVIVESWF